MRELWRIIGLDLVLVPVYLIAALVALATGGPAQFFMLTGIICMISGRVSLSNESQRIAEKRLDIANDRIESLERTAQFQLILVQAMSGSLSADEGNRRIEELLRKLEEN